MYWLCWPKLLVDALPPRGFFVRWSVYCGPAAEFGSRSRRPPLVRLSELLRAAVFSATEFWSQAGISSCPDGASDAVAIVAVTDGGTPPEVLASNMSLQCCCQVRANKVALMFVVVVGQWAAEVARSHLEVQIWPTLDLATVLAI